MSNNFFKSANVLLKKAGSGTSAVLKKAGDTFKSTSLKEKQVRAKEAISLQKQLNEKLIWLFSVEIELCRLAYQSGKKSIPARTAIPDIGKSYAKKNLIISEGAGLVPGFWGMAAAIPEIIMIIRNQIDMVYDIGMACGQQEKMSKEVVLYVFLSAMGIKTDGVATIQGNKLTVKKSTQPALQSIIQLIGLHVGRHLLGAMVAKWLPGIGATAMAIWSKYNTEQLAKKAGELFSMNIELSNEEISQVQMAKVVAEETGKQAQEKTERVKLQTVSNLIKSDGKIEDSEKEFLLHVAEHTSLPDAEKRALSESFNDPNPVKIDFSDYKKNREEILALLIELVALARRDQQLHPKEEAYIRTLAGELQVAKADLDSLLQVKVYADYTAQEKEYLEEVQFCLEDKTQISADERRLLDRKRQKLGLSPERAQQLEATLQQAEFTGSEIEYVNELKIRQQVPEADQQGLETLRTKLGISAERAKEIEVAVK